MPVGTIIHFSKEERAALKKKADAAEAALTVEQKADREALRKRIEDEREDALRKEVAASKTQGGRKKHKAGTRRRRHHRKTRHTRRR